MGWFRPLYRRVIVIGVIALWSAWEWLYNHEELWGYLTLGALGYGIWTFFINFEKELAKHDHAKPKD